jgi:lysophospholipase L1-like esterase
MLENGDKSYGLECYPEDPSERFPIDLREDGVRARIAREGGLDLELLEEVAATLPHCVPFRYNELTYRDAPFEPDPERRSVLVVGDSFCEGAGVVEEETFARRLERLLARDEPVRVWNGGRRGRDQPEIRRELDRLIPLVQPELTVYAMVLNDFEQDPAYRERQTYLNDLILDRQHMGRPTFRLPRALAWSQLATLFTERWRRARVTSETIRWYQGMTGPENRSGWQRTREDILHMADAVEAADGQFLVAIVPLLVGLEGRDYPFAQLHRDIRQALEELDIEHLDLLDAFVGQQSRELWVHAVDMHPNGRGHQIIAEALEPRVRALLAEDR